MANAKPEIGRCSFCYERFEKPLKLHYIDTDKPGAKSNCKHTSKLLLEGWSQTATGVWKL